MRINLIKCDLCHKEEDKPKGTPPEGWFTYRLSTPRSSQPLDLCPSCRESIKNALSSY